MEEKVLRNMHDTTADNWRLAVVLVLMVDGLEIL